MRLLEICFALRFGTFLQQIVISKDELNYTYPFIFQQQGRIGMPGTVCSDCGNCHFGPCATQETCFVWDPEGNDIPNQVLITGSWGKWQIKERLNKEVTENGEVFFRINLTLLAGAYEYKYIVDGVWKYNPKAPTVDDQHGSLNNFVKVYPKKMFIPVNKQGEIKISSCLLIEGLKIIGSWDNWTKQIPMVRTINHLKGCEEFVAYIPVEPEKEYEFKFRLQKQYLIDEKYPTAYNEFNTQNNVIITYKESFNNFTPIHYTNPQFSCKSFEWVTVTRTFDLRYKRVEGHTMCNIGDYIYTFGGYCRSEFYNSLTKVSTQLTSSRIEEALPEGRAFQNMVTYGNKIIIFGGHNKNVLQDYYSFNVSQQKWVAVPHISGKYPQKKEKQSCVLYEMLLVFFGGYYCSPDIEYEAYYKDISVLDIENMRWIDQIDVEGDQPVGRFAHTACLINSDMYIFGGTYNAIDNLNLNDIWKINLSKVNELTWVELKPKGVRPSPRHGHSMNALYGYLIVFGGQDDDGKYLNDLFIFDTNNNEWFQPFITGQVPRPRYYHASTLIHNEQLLIFGGRTKNQNTIENLYILKPAEHKIKLDLDDDDNEK